MVSPSLKISGLILADPAVVFGATRTIGHQLSHKLETISAKRAVDYFTQTARTLSDDAEGAGVQRLVCVSIAGAANPAVTRIDRTILTLSKYPPEQMVNRVGS